MGRLAGALALAAGLVLPVPAVAQFGLSGFVGTVTLAHYSQCQDFFCASAVVASGRSATGSYFAQLVQFDQSFDVAAFNEAVAGTDYYVDHEMRVIEVAYEEPNPAGADATWWVFFEGDEQLRTPAYGSAVHLGYLTVGFTVQHYEYTTGTVYGFENGFTIEPGLVTQVTAAPEPATFGLFGMGVVGIAVASRRRRST